MHLFTLPLLFAQASTIQDCVSPFFSKSDFVLSCGAAISEQMSKAWDDTWDVFITNPNGIYIALVNIGRIFALFSIVLFIYNFLRNMLADEGYHALSDLIWPIIVILLFVNDASLLRQSTSAMRGIINQTNTEVLTLADTSLQFEQNLEEVVDFASAQQTIRDIRAQCNGIPDNAQLIACLEGAQVQAQVVIASYNAKYAESIWSKSLLDLVQTGITNLLSTPQRALELAGTVVNSGISLVVEAFLASLQIAFQYLIELSFLLTAMLGPLALGLTLSPMGGKPLYGWLIAFFSVGLAKLYFNVITAILVTMIHKAGPLDLMADMILLGLLSPVLAFGMAAGGGMAIFNGVLATAQQVTMGLIPLGVGAALNKKGD